MSHRVIGIDLGGTNLRGALVEATGQVISRKEFPTALDRSREIVVEQIVDMVALLSQSDPNSIVGIGLGIAGFIDAKAGLIHSSPNFANWNGFKIGEALKKELAKPFYLENDANCAVLGEVWQGAGQGCRHVILLTLGTGVGGGLISEGKLIKGAHGGGSEVGHTVIHPEGHPCGCGGQGCLEQYVSGTALKRISGAEPQDLFEDGRQGSAKAFAHIEEMGRNLGIGLVSLCFLFDPEVIILGGKVSRGFSLFAPSMQAEMKRRLGRHPSTQARVLEAACGDDAGLLGAAKIVFNRTVKKI